MYIYFPPSSKQAISVTILYNVPVQKLSKTSHPVGGGPGGLMLHCTCMYTKHGEVRFRTGSTKLKSIKWQWGGFESETSGLKALYWNHSRPCSTPANHLHTKIPVLIYYIHLLKLTQTCQEQQYLSNLCQQAVSWYALSHHSFRQGCQITAGHSWGWNS